MDLKNTYIDSHCHLADERLDQCWLQLAQQAQEKGVHQFLQAGVDPKDWERQLALKKQCDGVLPVFGLHPYFVNATDAADCEHALDLLSQKTSQVYALGEMGLDFRPKILKASIFSNEQSSDDSLAKGHQIDFFEKQLELAKVSQKPIVMHVVQAFEEAYQILKIWGAPSRGGLVHAFNGSAAQAEKWMSEGLHISVGGALLKPAHQRLHQAVAQVPLERLCLETDTPDQPLPGREQSAPVDILMVAEKVAEIKRQPALEILDICSQNTRKLIGL